METHYVQTHIENSLVRQIKLQVMYRLLRPSVSDKGH